MRETAGGRNRRSEIALCGAVPMELPEPLSDVDFEAIFRAEPGAYPGFVGHTTLELAPSVEQPPPVLSVAAGQVDPNIRVSEAQAEAFVHDGFVVVEDLIDEVQLEEWRRQFWDVIGD